MTLHNPASSTYFPCQPLPMPHGMTFSHEQPEPWGLPELKVGKLGRVQAFHGTHTYLHPSIVWACKYVPFLQEDGGIHKRYVLYITCHKTLMSLITKLRAAGYLVTPLTHAHGTWRLHFSKVI